MPPPLDMFTSEVAPFCAWIIRLFWLVARASRSTPRLAASASSHFLASVTFTLRLRLCGYGSYFAPDHDVADQQVGLPDLHRQRARHGAAHARLVGLVVRYGHYLLDGVRALAQQHGAAHGLGDLAIPDHVALPHGEVVLAGAGAHLSSAQGLGVEAQLYAFEELLLGCVAGRHEGVAHARGGSEGVVLAPPGARGA